MGVLWRVKDRRGTMREAETIRGVKDTVGALEDDAALHHLSHDAAHWPDIHWERKKQRNMYKF